MESIEEDTPKTMQKPGRSKKTGTTMVKSLGNIIAQDDSRGDASSVAIVVIDIGSSGVDPDSFPCIHATRYQFVGTPWLSRTNFPFDDPVRVIVRRNDHAPRGHVKKFHANEFNECEPNPNSTQPEKNFLSSINNVAKRF